jgi:hypothetical protein
MYKKLTLAKLEQQAERNREKGSNRRKASYKLAKSLGFSNDEAVILQHRSPDIIRELSQERKTTK